MTRPTLTFPLLLLAASIVVAARALPDDDGGAAEAAAPLSSWQMVRQGDGVVDDVASGARVPLPFDRRVHVAILAEGFTGADLDARAFDAWVTQWLDEVLSIEPYDRFAEAFVVWKRVLVSRDRLAAGAPQARSTALRVPLSPDGQHVARLPTDGPTSALVWEALRDLPVPVTFYGPDGHSHRLARNLVVVVATLDPATGKPGLSGRAVVLTDPANRQRRVAVAIGHGRAHEFGHAFALLGDEYLDVRDRRQRGHTAHQVSNVVRSARCDDLPWKHLLPGSPLDPPTRGLVGAFGSPATGYHSELKCLMNGTHDNAVMFGGDGHLRADDRLCNFCREMSAFRLLERTAVLPDAARSLEVWATRYRETFFRRFGFKRPLRVPQTNSEGQELFQDCER